MPLRVTRKPWFGPKRSVGWGWSIASGEGRAVTALFVALMLLASTVWHSPVAVLVLIVLYVVVVALTGDPPGPPPKRRS